MAIDRRHWRRAAATALLLCASFRCYAAESTLRPDDEQRLRSVGDFHTLNRSRPLPREVLGFCADHNGLIAAPAERWNPTDVMFVGMPTRRLVWVSRSDTLFVVHYEQGGFVHSFHIAVARAKPGSAGFDLIWRADGPRLDGHADFLRALSSGSLREAPASIR